MREEIAGLNCGEEDRINKESKCRHGETLKLTAQGGDGVSASEGVEGSVQPNQLG